jgi:hypothetical protein
LRNSPTQNRPMKDEYRIDPSQKGVQYIMAYFAPVSVTRRGRNRNACLTGPWRQARILFKLASRSSE